MPTDLTPAEREALRPTIDAAEQESLKGTWEDWRRHDCPVAITGNPTGTEIAMLVRAALAAVPRLGREGERLDGLCALVDEVAERYDNEGTLRHGEVAIYRTQSGYAVQVRRRNGSAVECGRHGDLRTAIDAASPAPSAQGEGT